MKPEGIECVILRQDGHLEVWSRRTGDIIPLGLCVVIRSNDLAARDAACDAEGYERGRREALEDVVEEISNWILESHKLKEVSEKSEVVDYFVSLLRRIRALAAKEPSNADA